VGFIVIRAIVIIVPFLTLFTLDKISFLALILNPVVCFSVVDDITHVSFIPTLVALLRWSDAASRVPVWNQVVVKVLTPPSVSLLGGGGSSMIAASSMAWRRLTYVLTSSLSLGS
jgi:hypothetical protein